MKRLLVLALFLSTSIQAAEIKKWVDENGQIHYGDSPPAQVKSEPVRVNRPPSNPGKPLPRFNSNTDQEQPQAAQQPQPPKTKAPEVAQDEATRLCQEAKKDIEKMNRSDTIRVRSADGSIRYLSGEEKQQRRQIAEEDIKQFCK